MARTFLVHPDERCAISSNLIVSKCDLFKRDPTLTLKPYSIKSRVAVSVFRDFISALKGELVPITNENLSGLLDLSREFGFQDLTVHVERFQELQTYKQNSLKEEDGVHGRLARLEEHTVRLNHQIAALTRQNAALTAALSREERLLSAEPGGPKGDFVTALERQKVWLNLAITQQNEGFAVWVNAAVARQKEEWEAASRRQRTEWTAAIERQKGELAAAVGQQKEEFARETERQRAWMNAELARHKEALDAESKRQRTELAAAVGRQKEEFTVETERQKAWMNAALARQKEVLDADTHKQSTELVAALQRQKDALTADIERQKEAFTAEKRVLRSELNAALQRQNESLVADIERQKETMAAETEAQRNGVNSALLRIETLEGELGQISALNESLHKVEDTVKLFDAQASRLQRLNVEGQLKGLGKRLSKLETSIRQMSPDVLTARPLPGAIDAPIDPADQGLSQEVAEHRSPARDQRGRWAARRNARPLSRSDARPPPPIRWQSQPSISDI
jgi:hypothetical protein